MDPILLVIMIFIRMVFFVFKMIWMLCKWGFGWMMLGYFLDHYLSGGPSSPSHILFMFIAWGGTFLHFFGASILREIKKNKNQKQEQENDKLKLTEDGMKKEDIERLKALEEKRDNCTITESEEKEHAYLIWKYTN